MTDGKSFIILGTEFKIPAPPNSPHFPWEEGSTSAKKKVLRRRVKRRLVSK